MQARPKSKQLFQDLCKVIPGGVNSPVRACLQMEQLPMVVEKAFGDQLVDVDGHHYIDYCGSWGALIHGHAHPAILKTVQQRMEKGTSFGITTEIEERLASKVVEIVDSVDQVRFVSSGTEATMSAIRLARGVTGRELIVKFDGNYHGHHDAFLVQAGSGLLTHGFQSLGAGVCSEGVKQTISLPYNDVEKARQLLLHPDYCQRIAAVIIEPIAGNMGVVPATESFLDFLRKSTEKIGALLIFDEVMSGFRVALKGAQGHFGIKPDLTCFGKIIGGGFPAAAFGGAKRIMSHLSPLGAVYQAGTLSGNPVAMQAGLTSLELLQLPNFYEDLEKKVALLLNPIKELIKKEKMNVALQQVGSMFTLFFGVPSVCDLEEAKQIDQKALIKFFQTLFAQGIYIPPSPYEAWFVSSAHTEEHLIYTKEKIMQFLKNYY